MTSGTKKVTAWGLMLLMAFPLFLSIGMFIHQNIIQGQREQRLNSENLQTINISAEKLVWVKARKEVLINGRLFDVKSFKTSGVDILLSGFYDTKEDKLVGNIQNLNNPKNGATSPVNQVTIKFLFFANYKESISFSIQNNWQIINRQFPVYSEAVSTVTYAATAPPPKYS